MNTPLPLGRPACAGHPRPDIWFSTEASERAEAKAICAGCPERDACAQYAFQAREWFGIWGGVGEIQRQRQLAGPSRCSHCGETSVHAKGLCHPCYNYLGASGSLPTALVLDRRASRAASRAMGRAVSRVSRDREAAKRPDSTAEGPSPRAVFP